MAIEPNRTHTKKYGQSNPIERSPELNGIMAYTACNTVNRLARKEFNSNPVVLELSKEKETYTSSSRNISSIRKLQET